MNVRLAFIFFLLLVATNAKAQFVVSSGTDLATSTKTQIGFNNNLIINSNTASLANVTLILTGSDQTLTNGRTGSAIELGGLIVDGGGTKNLSGGTWEVNGNMAFIDGIVVPQTGSNGKIVHTSTTAAIGDIEVSITNQSYVNGIFYSKGTGARLFPIGNSGYFPALLTNVTQGDVEVGMQVANQNASLTFGSDILSVFTGQYWQLIDPSNTLVGSKVSLSSLGAGSYIDPNIGTVIIAASDKGTEGVSLGGSPSNDFIIGATVIKVTDRIFTLGKISSELVKVSVHNLITPLNDNANDYLFIENLDIFSDNTVMLLDRWGTLVREWKNYSNAAASSNAAYDLSKIATGNYICIVEYKDGTKTKKLSQMVTIINQ